MPIPLAEFRNLEYREEREIARIVWALCSLLSCSSSKLTWKSTPGDHGLMKPLVDKLIAFASDRGQ